MLKVCQSRFTSYNNKTKYKIPLNTKIYYFSFQEIDDSTLFKLEFLATDSRKRIGLRQHAKVMYVTDTEFMAQQVQNYR